MELSEQNQTGEPEAPITGLTPLNIIRTETVLSRLPIHNLAKKGRVSIKITKKHARGEVDLRWNVSASEEYGQARQLAYKLHTIIVARRVDEEKRPLPKIIKLGSLREICKELGLSAGKAKIEVKNAILQNASQFITAKLTYKGTDGSEHLLETGFTMYSVVFTGEKVPSGQKADGVYLLLNEPYWEVLNNAPIRPLDYDYLLALPPAAQRFYELVSYRMLALT